MGEIEHALLQCKGIQQAVVVAKSNASSDKQLVAYVVTRADYSQEAVMAHLKSVLPDYMVPATVVQLPIMPLTPSGKIDKKVLPTPATYTGRTAYVAPANSMETKLAEIWADILGVQKVGTEDNFFELGGHSLNAMRILSRVHKEIDTVIRVKDIFIHPTVKALSVVLSASGSTTYVPIPVVEKQNNYALSQSQQRLWVASQAGANALLYNVTGAYLLTGPLEKENFIKAYDAVIARHESLRTFFIMDRGLPRQKILAPEEANFKIQEIDLTGYQQPQQEAGKQIKQAFQKPFDLTQPPLLRANLIQLEKEKYVFTFAIHHIIFDGWSAAIFIREIFSLYTAYRQKWEMPLEPLPVQYKDFAAWQNKKLSGESHQQHKVYWLNQFNGEIPVLAIPTDHARPQVKAYAGNLLSLRLGTLLSTGIKEFSKTHNGSLFITLLTAINTLFYKMTSQCDIITGVPVAGREHYQLAEQLGFYVNTLPLRTRFHAGDNFLSLFEKVKTVALNGYYHQDYPFNQLVEQLNPSKIPGRSPFFDVMVSLLEANALDDGTYMDGGITVSPYKTAHGVSQFDISFLFVNGENGIRCNIEYDVNLFYEETILLWFEKLSLILQQGTASPLTALRDFSVQTATEKMLAEETISIELDF